MRGGGSLASRFLRAFQSSHLPATGVSASSPFVPATAASSVSAASVATRIGPLASVPTAAAASSSHSVFRIASLLSNLSPLPSPPSPPQFPPHSSPATIPSRSFGTSSPLAQSVLTRGLFPALRQQHVAGAEPMGASLVLKRGFAKRQKKWRGDPWVLVNVPKAAEQVPASQPNAGSVGGRNQRRRMLQRQLFVKEQWQMVKAQKKEALKRRDAERRAKWKAGAARAREWQEGQLAAAAGEGGGGGQGVLGTA
ncbi:hypothetical protein CLOM_g15563 [Closterium sp. NIES-68]|nr:hypothetical protein CLOM_g3411 [Closterium sp. NIES-68]GJP56498.1 hypothetical protein CLOM_g15563 [Closterium sp. NIES-68]GJP62235.1 hypothetical protein CLOP_g19319 [Closterium sp. NIES-67]GJP79531.1 hypothetical protein CLOP_g9756 [Closterium sp. NIES-67]